MNRGSYNPVHTVYSLSKGELLVSFIDCGEFFKVPVASEEHAREITNVIERAIEQAKRVAVQATLNTVRGQLSSIEMDANKGVQG